MDSGTRHVQHSTMLTPAEHCMRCSEGQGRAWDPSSSFIMTSPSVPVIPASIKDASTSGLREFPPTVPTILVKHTWGLWSQHGAQARSRGSRT